jgi:uncharacterized protein (TIGR03032 family)
LTSDPERLVLDDLLERHDSEFRDPLEIVGFWQDFDRVDPRVLEFTTVGDWWNILGNLDVTLLVSREYEHLLLAVGTDSRSGPTVTMMRLPHPSGIAVDYGRRIVHVAGTRNPNLIYDLMSVDGLMRRLDVQEGSIEGKPLFPVRARFLPGCFYIHDLAMIGDSLHANSVGQNAVIRIGHSGNPENVWWPKCIERKEGPVFDVNYLQLNSIAAGKTVQDSYFSASTDELSELRPGNPDFPVDGRGVIFSGKTRSPIARGLTRPHSARLHSDRIWVDNSGYGEVGYIDGARFLPVAKLPGWTRGLCFSQGVAFVGASRILPRFTKYAPGLNIRSSVCGVYALETKSGEVLGGMIWPYGSQIFSVEAVPRDFCTGLPFGLPGQGLRDREKKLFYCFQFPGIQEE